MERYLVAMVTWTTRGVAWCVKVERYLELFVKINLNSLKRKLSKHETESKELLDEEVVDWWVPCLHSFNSFRKPARREIAREIYLI